MITQRMASQARLAVRLAVKEGRLVRPAECPSCLWTGIIHGHHEDYANPLDVVWLCASCHAKYHADPRFTKSRLDENMGTNDTACRSEAGCCRGRRRGQNMNDQEAREKLAAIEARLDVVEKELKTAAMLIAEFVIRIRALEVRMDPSI